MRNLFPGTLLVAAFALLMSCMKPAPPVNVFHLGDKVQTGALIYNVLEGKWRAQIGEGAESRVPERRFLIVHLSVTNSGGQDLDIPSLSVVDQSGQVFNESMDGRGIPYWLGMIRKLKPADTLDGAVLFDVDPKSYKLKLDDGSGASPAMVELPLQFEAGESIIPSQIK
jgi:uncharacterized protein DUF4352